MTRQLLFYASRMISPLALAYTLLLWVFTPILCAAESKADEDAPRLNVVFLMVDDWGWTDAGCYGSDLYETPNIDALAARGVRFTDAYSACTVCSPTRAALMTGIDPATLRLTNWIPGEGRRKERLLAPDWTMQLEHHYTTLPEAMRDAGYRTGHVGKWHLMPPNDDERLDYVPERQGFEVNIGGNHSGMPGSYFHPYKSPRHVVSPLPPGGKEGDYLTDRLTDEAVKIIESWCDEPFFLYFAYYSVHTPIQAKKDATEYFRSRLDPNANHQNPTYAAMVQSVDQSVGRIVDVLQKQGIADRTAILLTGDNGGLSSERRNYGPTNNAPLREGKGHVYEGGVRVPAIVYWPGEMAGGQLCGAPIITHDLYPTVLSMAEVEGNTEHNSAVQGVDLTPVLRDVDAVLDRDALYWHYPHYHIGGAKPYSAVRAGDWRLIEFFEDNRIELYHLGNDPGERKNLAKSEPEQATKLLTMLHDWRKEVDAQLPVPNPNYQKE